MPRSEPSRPAVRPQPPGAPVPQPLPSAPLPEPLPRTVRCRRCGRPLHDPVARMLRLGRECRRPEEHVRVVAGDQEPLPGL